MHGNEIDGSTSSPATRKPEIVLGLDDSPAAAAALRWAAGQSRQTGLPLRVLHAWQLNSLESAVVGADGARGDLFEASAADARARATRWATDSLGSAAGTLRWRLEIVEGSPGPALVAHSRGSRLLVLGSQEHTGLRRAVLGSVSHYCHSHAEPPVVAVPAHSASHGSPRTDRLSTPGPLL